nr:hypothetical protein [uncultured Neokomagataea sp.]
MKKLMATAAWFLTPVSVLTASTPAAQDSSANYQTISVVSPVNSNNQISVPTYKGDDNQWHRAQAVIVACGLDSNNHPVSCDNKNSINQPDGVAGLNSSGEITAPSNTSTTTLSQGSNVGVFSSTKSYAGIEQASPILTALRKMDSSATWDTPGDLQGLGFEWDHTWMLGGHRADDKGHHFVFGQPVSGGLGGVVDGVFMNGKSAAQGTGVSAGTWGGMVNGNMNFDAATRATETGSTPPKFIASSGIQDPDGVTHAITFTATGATFSPALPAYWAKMLVPGMNIATNEIGVAKIPENRWNEPWNTNDQFRHTFNVYMGTISGWNTLSDGTVDSISLDTGWYVPQQNVFGYGATPGKIPGRDTLDGSTPQLDTFFTNYTKPVIEFGVFTKAFPDYLLCALNNNPRGDIADPNGSQGSLVHECDNEYDLWNHDPVDYRSSIHGLTMVFDNTGGGKLTRDSLGIGIAGGNALPYGIRVWNLLPNSIAYQAMGMGNITQHNIYQPEVVGQSVGSEYTAQNWQFSSGSKAGIDTSTLRLTQYRDTDISNGFTGDTHTTNSLHLSYKADGVQDPQSEQNAQSFGQIVWNPQNYLNGVALAAGGSFQAPQIGLVAMPSGPAMAPNGFSTPYILTDSVGAKTANGNINLTSPLAVKSSITVDDTSGQPIGAMQWNDQFKVFYNTLSTEFTNSVNIDAASQGLKVSNNTTTGSLTVQSETQMNGMVHANGALSAPYILANGVGPQSGNTVTVTAALQVRGGTTSDQPYALHDLPNTGVSDGAHAWCADCKLNGVAGVAAYWHAYANKWTDAMNNPLSN